MRTIIKYMFIFFILLFLGSCSKDFLDLTPNTYMNGSNYLKDENDVLTAINGLYPTYRNQLDLFMEMTEMRSDNTTNQYNPNLRALPSTDREELDEFRDKSANQYTNYWNVAYNAIYRANTILARIKDVSFTTAGLKDRSAGECLYTRAFFYFNLVRFYGDVPLITEPVTDVATAFSIGRSPIADIYAQMLNDINQAISLLPSSYSAADAGRITKGAAMTLLAKIQMTRQNYSDATTTLRAIAGLGYSLQPKYVDCFRPDNKNNSESIFEIQYSSTLSNQTNGPVLAWFPYGTDAWQAVFGYTGGNQYGYNIPTKDMLAAYEPGDLRKEVSVKSGIKTQAGDSIKVAYINKWMYIDPVPQRNNCNFPVYRLADIKLMLAEAINQVSGPTGEAIGLLNEIRSRAGLPAKSPASKEEMALALEQERRIELAFEGHRWFDLLRTGRAVEVMTAYGIIEKTNPSTPRTSAEQYDPKAFTIDAFRLLYAVPFSEIQKNPEKLTQNPGY